MYSLNNGQVGQTNSPESQATANNSGNPPQRPFQPVKREIRAPMQPSSNPLDELAAAVALHKPKPVNPYSWRKMAFFGLPTELAVLSAFTCLLLGALWGAPDLQLKALTAAALVGGLPALAHWWAMR